MATGGELSAAELGALTESQSMRARNVAGPAIAHVVLHCHRDTKSETEGLASLRLSLVGDEEVGVAIAAVNWKKRRSAEEQRQFLERLNQLPGADTVSAEELLEVEESDDASFSGCVNEGLSELVFPYFEHEVMATMEHVVVVGRDRTSTSLQELFGE